MPVPLQAAELLAVDILSMHWWWVSLKSAVLNSKLRHFQSILLPDNNCFVPSLSTKLLRFSFGCSPSPWEQEFHHIRKLKANIETKQICSSRYLKPQQMPSTNRSLLWIQKPQGQIACSSSQFAWSQNSYWSRVEVVDLLISLLPCKFRRWLLIMIFQLNNKLVGEVVVDELVANS